MENRIEKYAAFLVQTALNVQKGETLIINAPAEEASFATLCAGAAYDAGARDVVVNFSDDGFARLRMQRAGVEALEDVKPWRLRSYMDYVESEGGACALKIYASDPDLYKDIDPAKVSRATIAQDKALRPWMDVTMGNKVRWCVCSVPTEKWAAKVFPEAGAAAVDKLWEAILNVSRIDDDPAAAWEAHVGRGERVLKVLNGLKLREVHLQSANGTDLHVGLAEGRIWEGFREDSTAGVPFLANVPTEEVFTAPHRLRVDGVVKSSLPFVFAGNRIEGITFTFKEGKVVGHSAEKGEELLGMLLETDEGARHLGEIALLPASSPIRQSGLLFYNTLFDENAACHMALGAGYPMTVEGGAGLDKEGLAKLGVNDSLIHEDIMIGTDDMRVTGITEDGKTVPVMEKGEWALEGLE